MIKLRPLPGSFMLISMLGLAIFGVYTVSGRVDATWGFTMLLFFGIMFVASIFSMTPSSSKADVMPERPLRKAAKKSKKKK